MIGFAVGIVAGGVQFWLLSKFTKCVSAGQINMKTIGFGLVQFFLPMAVLVGVAFIVRSEILWTGIGITASLLIGAVVKSILNRHKEKGRENTDA